MDDKNFPVRPIQLVSAGNREIQERGLVTSWDDRSNNLHYTEIRTEDPLFCEGLGGWDVHVCAYPTDTRSCEDFEHWTHRKNSYISGYPGQYYGFDNLYDAQVKCLEIEGCVGVTKETTNKFTLRASDHFVYSFDGEESWLKPAHACNQTPDKDCTDFNGWESQGNSYLSGCDIDNCRDYYRLEDAQINAVRFNAGGVTKVGNIYQVRAGSKFEYSPSGETSWLRPEDACEISRDDRTPSEITSFSARDSGAPLVIHSTEGDKLLGVGSYFRSFSAPGYPGLFTNFAEKHINMWLREAAFL